MSSGIVLRVHSPNADPPISNGYDVLIRLEFTLEVEVDGKVHLAEDHFMAVELAYALHAWLMSANENSGGFEFDSMDDDRPGLLWIRPPSLQNLLWGLGSSETGPVALAFLSFDDIVGLVRSFIEDVSNAVQAAFGLDPMPLISRGRPLTTEVRFTKGHLSY